MPTSIRVALNRIKGSRGCGSESLQKALEGRGPGAQYV